MKFAGTQVLAALPPDVRRVSGFSGQDFLISWGYASIRDATPEITSGFDQATFRERDRAVLLVSIKSSVRH
jgi:hypothetical protein